MAYSRAVKEVSGASGEKGKYTLLALNPLRFPGDLEVLANSGEFRVLKLPFDWMGRILRLVWNDDFDFSDYFNPAEDSELMRARKKLNKYLKILIKPLFTKLKVDAVLSASVYYKQDYEWAKAAEEVGFPFIVLHKESLVGAQTARRQEFERFAKMEKFPGSQLIVHNENMKRIFIDSGYATEDKVSALGCIRMDNYINMIHNYKGSSKKRKSVLLFSFHYCADVSVDRYFDRTHGYVKFFEHVHVSMAELAQRHPDIDFIIKTKWAGQWYDEVNYVLRKNGFEPEKIPNLIVTKDLNVHEAILDSTVVCSYGSTTVLEAAIAGKPVVVPFFDEPLEQDPETITLMEYFKEFYVADSPANLIKLIETKLEDPSVPLDKLEIYRDIFSRNVSPWEGNSLEKYTEKIKEIINAQVHSKS
jgi:glycosyltransferase involved in cell wall biosynthesis